MSEPVAPAYKYYAFISYSRKDSKVAAWLQKRLEWFRFPVKLVPEDRRPPDARYIRPIYRDKTNLEVTNEHYWTNIRRALEESRYLVVLTSPHSAASEPVNMEVAHFLDTHGDDASLVVPVIVSGNVIGTGDNAAFCPALRALGDALLTRNLPTMVPDAVTAEPDAWEQGFVSLVSYLLRLERTALGDHIQRETKRQARVLRRWLVAVGMLTVIAAVSAWLALKAKREVEKANAVIVEKNRAVESANDTLVQRKKELETANREITAKKDEIAANLHEASMADYNVAVQRIEKEGKWPEGVAHFARALDREPKNMRAAMRLYGAIVNGTKKQIGMLRFVSAPANNDSSILAGFSADSSQFATLKNKRTELQVWDTHTGQALGGLMRHEGEVSRTSFSPDGTRVVTCTWDGTARIWDVQTGEALGDPMRHEYEVTRATFSPDGTRIVTATGDKMPQMPVPGYQLGRPLARKGTVRMWDWKTGKQQGAVMRHEGEVNSVEFSPNGAQIVTASSDKTARVWDAATGKQMGKPMSHEESVESATFSPDGFRVVTTSGDHTVRVWNTATGKPLSEPMRHEGEVEEAAFSPDGTRIVTASLDGSVRLWVAATGKQLGEPMRHEAGVKSARFSPDGIRIVTVGSDGTVRVWNVDTAEPLGEPLHHEGEVSSATFNSDGTQIVTDSDDVRVWDAQTGQSLGEPLRHGTEVVNSGVSDEGSRIVTASYDDTMRVWDVQSGKVLGEPIRHRWNVSSPSFSPDGTRIVAADWFIAQVRDVQSSKPLGEPMRHANQVVSCNFSPDGTWILTASWDETAQLWDAATGKPIGNPMNHGVSLESASFSPNGTRIVTVSKHKAWLWDVQSQQHIGEPMRPEHFELKSVSFSSDSTRIITADAFDVQMWDAAIGKPIGKPIGHEHELTSAIFSPDGSRIITTSKDGAARVWDAVTGNAIGEQLRHEGPVRSAQFSADGTRVVTASDDKTARVWDAVTGTAIGEPLRHDAAVFSASFCEDGTRIVTTSSGDSTARLWELHSTFHLPLETPEWVTDWARAVCGWQFDSEGVLKPIPAAKRVRIMFTPHIGEDPWSKLARWLAQPAKERTLTPDSKFTCRQIAERERDSGFKEGIESALRYDPTVPLAHVLLAKFEDNPQRASFLRGYGLKLLPEDASLWARAAASLIDQTDFRRALQAADKALSLDPNNTDAQKARAAALQSIKSK